MSAPPKPLRSALKKSSTTSTHALAQASSSKVKAGPSTSSKGKSKGSVTLATRPTRFKGSDLESESEGNASGFEGVDEDVEMDTDEEIERSKEGKEGKKSGNKRKRSTTTANEFGSTLTSLLADPLIQKSKSKKPKTTTTTEKETPSAESKRNKAIQQPILALSAHKPPAKASVSLEAKARRQLKAEKEEKQDKARVKDVVEGWSTGDGVMGGMEFEKSLRKTAQRGVIKLFNAILLASKNSEAAMTSLSAQAKLKPEVGKKKEKDNILGRGGNKDDVLTKESFLDMVRKGSTR